jgi:hypothetical protein
MGAAATLLAVRMRSQPTRTRVDHYELAAVGPIALEANTEQRLLLETPEAMMPDPANLACALFEFRGAGVDSPPDPGRCQIAIADGDAVLARWDGTPEPCDAFEPTAGAALPIVWPNGQPHRLSPGRYYDIRVTWHSLPAHRGDIYLWWRCYTGSRISTDR